MMKLPTYKLEQEKIAAGFLRIAGCDEVGRGPLVGPVVAASIIINPETLSEKFWLRVRDSKTLSEKKRIELDGLIRENSFALGLGDASHETIDKINIHEASLLAMKRSIDSLGVKPNFILVDGKFTIPNLSIAQQAIIDGDALVLSIAAASIVAKVYRDNLLKQWDEIYPQYGFMKHKGYATKVHLAAIKKFGVLPIHRKTFGFVKQYLNNL